MYKETKLEDTDAKAASSRPNKIKMITFKKKTEA